MTKKQTEMYFLLGLLVIIFTISFFIFRPFIYALILALVFATIFDPVQSRFLGLFRGRHGLSALSSTLFILFVFIVPLSLLGTQIFREASSLYYSLIASGSTPNLSLQIQDVLSNAKDFLPLPDSWSVNVNDYLEIGLGWFVERLGPIFTNVAKAVLNTFVFLMALYYVFKDRTKLKEAIIKLSPLQDSYDEKIFEKLTAAVNSVVKGSLSVALVQGFLTAVGFALFGVPNPTLWGAIAAIAALIPGVGTSLVLLPAIFYLFITNQLIAMIGLLVWGTVAVGLVDNFLGPRIVGRGTQLHPLLILLSILGGIVMFGPIGFLIGPITLSLLFALLEIYFLLASKNN
jgi:predicted PurR-regulated permease PerM